MKEYPVGSVCVIVKCEKYSELMGVELTITGPMEWFENNGHVWQGYSTDLEHNGMEICPKHDCLRLKKLPPKDEKEDEAFRSFLDKVMKPVDLPEEEIG